MTSVNKAVTNNLIWVSGISFQAWLYELRPIFTNGGEKGRMLTAPPHLLLALSLSVIPQEPHGSDPQPKWAPSAWDRPVPTATSPGIQCKSFTHKAMGRRRKRQQKCFPRGCVSLLKKWGFTPHDNITIIVILRLFAEVFQNSTNP